MVSNRVALPGESRAGRLAIALKAAMEESGGLWFGWSGRIAAESGHMHEIDAGNVRYIAADDFGTPETSFTICTFWYIDALAAIGRLEEARGMFERLLSRRNPLGLLSEDLAFDGEPWGNFPQTYSHVGLIIAAMRLSRPWRDAV